MEQVTLMEIRSWSDAIFAAIERRGIERLEMTEGFYWSYDTSAAWLAEHGPEGATLGDLADDIADIRGDVGAALTDPHSAAQIVWHTLDHYIGVLQGLSHQMKRADSLSIGGDSSYA